MIDHRFSIEEFKRDDYETTGYEGYDDLTEALKAEIRQELDHLVWPYFSNMIARLNQMGHDLRLYEDREPCDYAFRDDKEDESGYSCKLRVAFDGTATSGYADADGSVVSNKSLLLFPSSGESWSRLGRIDRRFSAEAFARSGLDTVKARELADMLSHELSLDLHKIVWPAFKMIVHTLNGLGHNLKPYTDVKPGEYVFRDDWRDEDGYHCGLRVAFDYLVITGYFHPTTLDEDELGLVSP